MVIDEYKLPEVLEYRWETNVLIHFCEGPAGPEKYIVLNQKDDEDNSALVVLPSDDIIAIADKLRTH